MSEYVIKEDRLKLLLYIVFCLCSTIVLLIVCAGLYSMGAFLFSFLAITGLWFSIKALWKYGSKWMKRTPICEFSTQEVILHAIPYENQIMKYKDIKEVKLLRNKTSIKLFFAGDHVEHPSGYTYVGITYVFQKNLLDEIEQQCMAYLRKHHVMVRKVEK